jgi:cardiolipin synthase
MLKEHCYEENKLAFPFSGGNVVSFCSLNSTMSNAFTLAGWIVIAILGSLFLLFLIVYLRGAYRNRVRYKVKNIPGVHEDHFPQAMMTISTSILTQGKPVGFWYKPDNIYKARLQAIEQAKRRIHFETFFMTPGKRPDEFAKALVAKVKAGVEVKLVVDSFGAWKMPMNYWHQLRAEGVKYRFFNKLNLRDPLTYNIRTHRKMLLIDGKLALVGGMGVSDYWDGKGGTAGSAPWSDVEVAFQGEVVQTLESIFMQHWIDEEGEVDLEQALFQPKILKKTKVLVTPTSPPGESSPISRLFFTNILAAKERIWIASPYFLCDINCRPALIDASRNGIDVRVLTVGPYYDHKYIYLAARELFGQFLKAGIKIYEYQPNMMHSKLLLVDDCWVSTGSTNFDPRSFFHNAELNLSWSDPEFAQRAEDFFMNAFDQSNCLTMKEWKSRSLWEQVQGQLALFGRWQL